MSIITKQSFISQARLQSNNLSFKSILEGALNEDRLEQSVSVFLSHSHLDKDMIEAGIVYFKGISVSMYVDWEDDSMPNSTSGITAARIKQKIRINDKFILLATNNAVASKWCNWELGIGDIRKLKNDNLAIIPLADNDGKWAGNEYLQMYPRIEEANNIENKGKYKVVYPDGRPMIWLKKWLMK
jgi:hypothetical protein